MKKNLFQPEARAEILSRIDSLTPQTKGQWGKMNVNQMLWHTNHGLQSSLGEFTTTYKKPNPLVRSLMRFVVFKTDMPTPKGKAETFGEINTVAQGINPNDFHAEREQLKETLNKFTNAKKYAPESPLLGPMTKEQWGRLHYSHLDHHLKQFGA